jgi:hypothetical protein
MGVRDDPGGPVVPGTWVTSQKAVNAFEAFCLGQGWVFTETPEQTDFGKDGYLDFSKEGRLTGQCIALQIKGGVSFRRGGSYVIPADRRRRTFWSQSSVPVFGIVWGPRSRFTRGRPAPMALRPGNSPGDRENPRNGRVRERHR